MSLHRITCDFLLFTALIHLMVLGITCQPAICNLDCQVNINETVLAKFCSASAFKLQGRCCVNTTSPDQFDIIGIDLQQCGMTQKKFSQGIDGINTLQFIYLQGNDIDALNNTDFHRNTGILNLSIPVNLSCPGGIKSWESIETETSETTCVGEKNPCISEKLACPPHSHCVHSGIDMSECLCDEDYHGYKCMNKGKFPTVPFAIGITASTVALCIFLWCTQRRYVKSDVKNK
ncbi:all-trans retinoic acid-induced differentiation factor-like isoform X1 [Biomphalaria pfeifferi]|uniref:All-trans retinoic acid-induced differentiation factor-like isoform X1 n=1 Tax=Biomphalaria pfeifferi TaxID=112525 RepID=A0AAD8B016_BIOPF|nr:all-trans retinoic acid-induced differentiation factor-like isoform X1 [Biomphalaria pfeifferi]